MKVIGILFAVVMVVFAIKNEVTFRNHKKIQDAIYRLKFDFIKRRIYNIPVDYEDMESYNKTLFRIWDWGYSRILPPEKMDLIKPYIK